MVNKKRAEIQAFFNENSNSEIVKKYSRYFKKGFDGYGIKTKTFEQQRDIWIEEWKDEMTLDTYLDLGDILMKEGKYEEKSLAIVFVQYERNNYTSETFDRIGK